MYYLRDNPPEAKSYKLKANIAVSFEAAAFDVLIIKTLRAAKEFKAKSILVSGGVAANRELVKQFNLQLKASGLRLFFSAAPKEFCTDNAAMIGAAGYINFLRNKNLRLFARGNLSI